MTFRHAVQSFLQYCDLERALSPNTLIAYADDLKHFGRFASATLGPDFTPLLVDKLLIRGFIASLRERGLRIATIQRRVNCLRSFWSFLIDCGIETRESPLDGLRLPRKEHRVAAFLGEQEMLSMLAGASEQSRSWSAVRDHAVLATLLFSGVRRTELLNLCLPEVRLDEDLIVVRHGKGRRSRVVPVAPELDHILHGWPSARPAPTTTCSATRCAAPWAATRCTICSGRPRCGLALSGRRCRCIPSGTASPAHSSKAERTSWRSSTCSATPASRRRRSTCTSVGRN